VLCEPAGTNPNDKLLGERVADPELPPPPEPPEFEGPEEPPLQPARIRMKHAEAQNPARTRHFFPSRFPPQISGRIDDRIMFGSLFTGLAAGECSAQTEVSKTAREAPVGCDAQYASQLHQQLSSDVLDPDASQV
jgi:hypothetical protein